MATPTHHQPVPTSASAAAAFFKCTSSHCALGGEACAVRWRRANPDPKYVSTKGAYGRGSPLKAQVFAAGCVGCAAGEARFRLLNATGKDVVAEMTREVMASAPPAAEAEALPENDGISISDDLSHESAAEAILSAVMQAYEHNEAADQLREDLGLDKNARSPEQTADLSDIITATLRAQLSAEARADEEINTLQSRANVYRAERDDLQAQLSQEQERSRALREAILEDKGTESLAQDLRMAEQIACQAYLYNDGAEDILREKLKVGNNVHPEQAADLYEIIHATHVAQVNSDERARESLNELKAQLADAKAELIRVKNDYEGALQRITARDMDLSAAIGDIEKLTAENAHLKAKLSGAVKHTPERSEISSGIDRDLSIELKLLQRLFSGVRGVPERGDRGDLEFVGLLAEQARSAVLAYHVSTYESPASSQGLDEAMIKKDKIIDELRAESALSLRKISSLQRECADLSEKLASERRPL